MNKARLRYEMDTRSISVEDLCAYIGISKSAFYKKLNGKSEFTRREIEMICQRLELDSPVDIFFADKVSERTQKEKCE